MFKPYKMEIGRILGEFDGHVMSLDLDGKNNMAVYKHEVVHSFISRSLPDGMVLLLLHLLNKKSPSTNLSLLLEKHEKSSINAHETAATFLGMLTTEKNEKKRIKFIKKLDAEYQKYFENYQNIVSGLSWVTQYAICYALTIYIFSSPAITNLRRDSFDLDALHSEMNIPDERLKVVLGWFTPQRRADMVGYINECIQKAWKDGTLPKFSDSFLDSITNRTIERQKSDFHIDSAVKFARNWLYENGPLTTIQINALHLSDIIDNDEILTLTQGAVKSMSRRKHDASYSFSQNPIDEEYSDSILRSALYTKSKNPIVNQGGNLIDINEKKLIDLESIKRTSFYFLITQKGKDSSCFFMEHFWSYRSINARKNKKIYNMYSACIRDGYHFFEKIMISRQMHRGNPAIMDLPKASCVIYRVSNAFDSYRNPLFDHFADQPVSEKYICPYNAPLNVKMGLKYRAPHIPHFPIIWYLETEIEFLLDVFNRPEYKAFWALRKIDRNFHVFILQIHGVSGVFIKILPNTVVRLLKLTLPTSSARQRLHPLWRHEYASEIKKDVKSAVEKIRYFWEEF